MSAKVKLYEPPIEDGDDDDSDEAIPCFPAHEWLPRFVLCVLIGSVIAATVWLLAL